ncbi:hypothetical protein SUNI508_00863 [Seiridium unicorne]|uniref:Uncharacterized protein n=1 Tax=Seiridium unicorne TaxID=138068 RepID=A0ABR2V1H4_9PEZI
MRSTFARFGLTSLWVLQLWVQFAHAASLEFLYPTGSMTFYYMNTVAVKYESNFSNPALYTFCRVGSGSPNLKFINYTSPYNATALITLSFTTGSQCWFNMRSEASNDAEWGFNSVNWNYKIDSVNETTVGLSTISATLSPTTTSSTSSATTTSTTSSTSSSSTPTTTSESSRGLSVGAQAGIGVGVGIAGLVAIVAIIALVIRRRKRQQPDQAVPQQQQYLQPQGPSTVGSPAPTDASTHMPMSNSGASTHTSPFDDHSQKFRQTPPGFYTTPQMQELDGRSNVYELPGH